MLDRPHTMDTGASAPVFHVIDREIETHCNVDNLTNENNIVSSMKRGLPEFFDRDDLESMKSKSLAIVGGGWSLKETLEELRGFDDIMVCGTAHDYLIKQGVKPKYAVLCDGAPRVIEYLNEDSGCEYFVASSCHPSVFDKLEDRDVTIWHTAWAVEDEDYKRLGIKKRIGGGCTVTLNALPLAVLLGYKDLHFFGMDSCRKETWHSYSQYLIDRKDISVKVDGTDKVFTSTAEMIAQAQQFSTMVWNFSHLFNYTVHGNGLIAAMIEHSRKLEAEAEKNDTLTAVYDLSCCPPTYDVVGFLLWVESERRKWEKKKVHIVLLKHGPNGGYRDDQLWPHDVAERDRMLLKVVKPLAEMLPNATVEISNLPENYPKPVIGLMEAHYGLSVLCDSLKKVGGVLRPDVKLPYDKNLVTITFRECDYWPTRNTKNDEWVKAAGKIKSMGFRVLFVRDTSKSKELSLGGFPCNRIASEDIKYRAALYRSAYCNFFIANGPAALSIAADAPTIMLRPTTETTSSVHGDEYHKKCGIFNSDYPGMTSKQKVVWKDDICENIVTAFENFTQEHKQ